MTALELGMVLLSALLHAVWNAYAKDTDSPTAFLALLAIISVIPSAALLLFVDLSQVPSLVWWIVCGSSLIHTSYSYCLARAYETGDLSVVYPISRSTPAIVALIAIPLLDDPVTIGGAAGIAVVMVGMWLVHTNGRVEWKALLAPGIGWAYVTLLTTAGYSLTDKLAMKHFSSAVWDSAIPEAIVYSCLLQVLLTLLFVPIAVAKVPRAALSSVARKHWGRLIFGMFASLGSYVLILHALRTASVSYVTAVRQSSVVFAAILSLVILRERPTRARIIGALLNVVGVAIIALTPD